MKKGFKKNRIISIVAALVLISAFLVCAFWQGLVVREYEIKSSKLISEIKIALVTDLHSTIYGKNQQNLVDRINASKPDIILLSGDIADDEVPHDGTEMLLSAIGNKYPCYYVTGNHEFWSGEVEAIKAMIASYGVNVLCGETKVLALGEQSVTIGGIDDPAGIYDESEAYLPKEYAPQLWHKQLQTVCRQNDGKSFSVLLSHRPEQADAYAQSNFDLVVAGHAHGGQVRIPFLINGVYSPNQGLFPEYAGGLYDLGETDMVVSRGLCIDRKLRVFNPPELVIINIQPK